MKIHGKKITGFCEEVVVIPRNDGNLVFRAKAVSDYSNFEKVCPEPKGDVKMFPGGREVEDTESPAYIKRYTDWLRKKTHWMILQSLKGTPGLEWETVDLSDSDTWHLYEQEMTDSGLSPAEQGRIVQCVSLANGLDQSKIDEATESFLAGQGAQEAIGSSPVSEQPVTPSGEPASVSV
jgi:hypothetical protein